MPLTPVEITQYLREARTALHALQVGQSVVEVRDSSGESVRYTPGNVSRLKAYIAELELMLIGESRRVVRPMVPVWG